MRRYTLFCIIICNIIIVIMSCSDKKDHTSHKNSELIALSDFGKEIHLLGEDIEFEEIVFNPYKMIIKDSILVLYNVRTEFVFQTFNLNNFKYMGEHVLFGQGPNEMIRPTFIQTQDSNIWILDTEKQMVFQYFPNDFIAKKEPIPVKIINLKIETDQLSLIEEQFFGAKMLESTKSRFVLFDMNGDSIYTRGIFPPNNIDFTYQETTYGYTSNYVTNFKDRIFLTHYFTDLIEIYDTAGNLINRIQGPDYFLPHVKEYKTEDISFGYSKEDARVAYSAPANAGDEVFVIYSGGLYSEDNGHKKNILVFDWNGKPIRKYELDKPVYGITIDIKNRYIYGLSDIPECHVVRFKY
ncbi:MAG: BF3164 family lipoprotein [Dysgonomonas sp.]